MQAARSSDAARNIERLRRAASTGLRSCIEPLEKRTLLSVTAAAANTPPAVTPPGLQDVAVTEDAPNTEVDLWAAFEDAEDQDSQLTYAVTANTNAALFRVVSVDATTGRLVLNYTPDASGTADITVRATDNGTADSPPAFVEDTFTVTVAPVNDAPSFTKGADQVANEDSGPQTVAGWATNISPGPADEAGQQVAFQVTTDKPAFFAAGPSVAPDGNLTYTPARDAKGTAVVTVVLTDDGGTAGGGQDASAPQTFTIVLNNLNDPPTFGSIADRVIPNSASQQTVTITGVSAGPGEGTAGVTLTAVSDNPSFIPNPVITGTGSIRRLTYDSRPGVDDSAVITVTARDSAGLEFSRTFRIRVGAVAAPPAADANEFVVNTHTAGAQRAWAAAGRSVATDAQGNFVVTWASLSQGDDESWGVYAQRYNAAGEPQGEEFRVNETKPFEQQTPTIAVAPDGSFVIAWQSYGGAETGWNVYARRYSANGTPQGGEFVLSDTLAGDQVWPSVAAEPDGDFVAAWTSGGQDGSGDGIYARRFRASGVPYGPEFRVNTHTDNNQSFPTVATSASGRFLVAWQSNLQDGSDFGIYAQQYSPEGVAQGDEVRVNDATTGRQSTPAAAASGSGWVVTWTGTPDFTVDPADVYVRRMASHATGAAPEGPETVANSTAAGTQRQSTVTSDADGNFIVSWEGIGSGWDVFAQRYDVEAAAVGEEFRLHAVNVPDQQSVGLAMTPDGGFVATWTSLGQDGSSFGVFARRFHPADTPDPGTPLAVTFSEFRYQAVPHRLRIGFDADVSASLADGDLTVRNLTTGQDVAVTFVSYEPATNTATFSFDGAAPNGNYRATLPSGAVSAPGKAAMASDHVFEFYSLVGDVNRDRAVNGSDFAILAGNFGRTGTTFAQGDVNGDGSVNGSDFALLAGNFGKTVPPPPPPPAPIVAAASAPQSAAVAPAASPTPAAKAAAPKKARAQKKPTRRAQIKDRLRAARRAR